MAKKASMNGSSKKSGKKESNSKAIIIASAIVVVVALAILAFKFDLIKVTGQEQIEEETAETLDQSFAAKVNGYTIYEPTLDKQYELFFTLTGYPEQYREVITKEDYLNQLVVESLIMQEAEKEGITIDGVSDAEVSEIIDSYLGQLQYSKEDFVKMLVAKKLTIDDVTDYFRRQIVMLDQLNRTVLDSVKVSDEEIEQYYDDNKDDFMASEGQIRARHILVDTLAEAEEVIGLLDTGADFTELAAERSNDPGSAPRGGDLGFFVREQMITEFSDAAFALEDVGDISEPVKSEYGYHIIQKESDTVSLEEAREGIEMLLLTNKQKAELERYLEELKAGSEIEIN